jgi:hypothetical protein
MANPLRLKKGLAANLPTLAAGEPAFTTDTKKLYIGDGTSNTEIGSVAGTDAITTAGTALSKSAQTLNHQNYGTAGTYAKVTTNAQGHVTAGAALAAADIPSSLTSNAATATKLAATKTIALSGKAIGTATAFDGSANITIPVTAVTDAAKLTTARTIALTGAVTGSTSFDGSANASIAATIVGTSGTWVPVMTGDSVAGSYTLSSTAKYYKIGKMVYICADIKVQAMPTQGHGYLKITGVPFTPNRSFADSLPVNTLSIVNIGNALLCSAYFNGTAIQLHKNFFSAGTSQPLTIDTLYPGDSIIRFSGWYETTS